MKKKVIIACLIAVYLTGLTIIVSKMITSYKRIARDLIQSYTGIIVNIEEEEEFEINKEYGELRSYSLLYIKVDDKTVRLKDYSDDRIKRYIGEYIDIYTYTLDHNHYDYNNEAVVIANSGLFYYILGIIIISLLLHELIALVSDFGNRKKKEEKLETK